MCLECHEPLRARIESGDGYHVASDATKDCARCHKEHFGRDFELVRWEPPEFDHAEIGWAPEGAHTALDCRECHNVPDRPVGRGPYLQGSLRLAGPHLSRARHGVPRVPPGRRSARRSVRGTDLRFVPRTGRLGRPRRVRPRWDPLPLTGLHRRVECAGCHPPQAERASGAGGALVTAGRASTPTAELRFTGALVSRVLELSPRRTRRWDGLDLLGLSRRRRAGTG